MDDVFFRVIEPIDEYVKGNDMITDSAQKFFDFYNSIFCNNSEVLDINSEQECEKLYTVVTFSEDGVLNDPMVVDENANYIAYTTKDITSNVWKVIKVNPAKCNMLAMDINSYIDKPLYIVKNTAIINYSFTDLTNAIKDAELDLVIIADGKHATIPDIMESHVTNEENITKFVNMYKYLKPKYDMNMRGTFVGDFIGFLNKTAYTKFMAEYAINKIKIDNDGILYTYIINTFFNRNKVIPLRQQILEKKLEDIYYNEGFYYNRLEKLVF